MPIPRVSTNSYYHLLMLWENQKASYYLHLKSLFLGQRGLKNREKFQKKNKKPRKRERKRKLDGQRERERERRRRRWRWRWSSSSQISPQPQQSNFSPNAHFLFLLPNLSWFYVDVSFVLFSNWSVLVFILFSVNDWALPWCCWGFGSHHQGPTWGRECRDRRRWKVRVTKKHFSFSSPVCIYWPKSDISPIPLLVELAYGSSSFFGWTPVRLVLSQLTDTRFSRLKKLNFSLIPGFSSRTARSGSDFKTLLYSTPLPSPLIQTDP